MAKTALKKITKIVIIYHHISPGCNTSPSTLPFRYTPWQEQFGYSSICSQTVCSSSLLFRLSRNNPGTMLKRRAQEKVGRQLTSEECVMSCVKLADFLVVEPQGSNRAKICRAITLPHTGRFFVSRRKIFTCRLVCGGFSNSQDIFLNWLRRERAPTNCLGPPHTTR